MLAEFRKVLPNEDCIFFGDTKNMPYGEKTKEQLIEYSSKAFKFFEEQNVKAVIMACNTTSAVVYEDLKDKYNFKLYPLIQSVSKIFASESAEIIGVFATPATINSHAYSKWINTYNPKINVVEIACPEWVKLVEAEDTESEHAFNSVKKMMEKMLTHNPQKIILGCTHYPYLINQLSKFKQKETFINPATAYADYIKNDLADLGLLKTAQTSGTDKFYVSDKPDNFVKAGRAFYNINSAELIKF